MNYYLRPEPRCPECGKPVTDSVLGAGNVLYGRYCEKHARIKLKELRKEQQP